MTRIQNQDVVLRDGERVTLFTPGEEDVQAVIDYFETVRGETDFLISCPDDPLPTFESERNWIRHHAENPSAVLICAKSLGRVIALAAIEGGRSHRIAHRGTVGISILRTYCDRGLGSILMERLITWARDHSTLEKLSLGVFSDNPRAIGLYRKCGFVEEGVRKREVRIGPGEYKDEIVMGLWLGKNLVL